MSRFFLFFLTFFTFQLHGMENYVELLSCKTTEELEAISENVGRKFTHGQQQAADTILDQRNLPWETSSPRGGYTPEQQWHQLSHSHVSQTDAQSSLIGNVAFVAAAFAIVWTIAEACNVYKNITAEEWNQAEGAAKKAALIASKTGTAMESRPQQTVALGRDVINKLLNQ